MVKKAKVVRQPRREKLPEVGGILHLEHFNFEVDDHDMATIFFMNGLGLTRDPFRRPDETNMGVNIGMQQFHLPRRGRPTPPFNGEIGLVVPDLPMIKARLARLERMGKFDGTPYAYRERGAVAIVTSPFGVRLRLHPAGSISALRPLGIAYVDVFVEPGKAKPIADFYRRVMEAPAELGKVNRDVAAVVTMGAYQVVRFREKKLDDYDLHNFHVAYYVSRYNQIRDRVSSQGSMLGQGRGQVFFFEELFDPDTDKVIIKFQQEPRSVYHPDFMRPLVNRWPIISEPYTDQADVMAGLIDVPGLIPS